MSWGYYRKKRPARPARVVKDGIKASRVNTGHTSWWAQEWMKLLEVMDEEYGNRLARGKTYARLGQVISIDITPGHVKSLVQGTQSAPYQVEIHIEPILQSDWDKIIKGMVGQAYFLALLLAGQMPDNIEDVFDAAGASLFPRDDMEMDGECTCPDWAVPCKHTSAVYFLLGEEFDRDPFLLFLLRGMPREELLYHLRVESGMCLDALTISEIAPEPLPTESLTFWTANPLPEIVIGECQSGDVTAPLLRRIGNYPFWRGSQSIIKTLSPNYISAARHGSELALRFSEDNQPEA